MISKRKMENKKPVFESDSLRVFKLEDFDGEIYGDDEPRFTISDRAIGIVVKRPKGYKWA